jgi:RNA polymerase sigma-70 factor, ECF subfamily
MPAADHLSVADLLLKARGNDPRDLERLFAECRNYLHLVARAQVESWLRAKVDASDLVQQTLLEAYRGFGNFEGRTSGEWRAWLRCIAENNAADVVRHYHGTGKRQVGREAPLPETMAFLPDDVASPSQELLVAEALERLSEDHRRVIMLRNLQRLPFDEVARRMGRSRPAVQMLWLRALRQLQEQVAGC